MAYYRRVIRITAEDSPNVALGLLQQRLGLVPTGETLVEGVMPWADYLKRRTLWTEERQCIGLDAMFWEGKESMLYPSAWLMRAARLARELRPSGDAEAVGIDPAEGGDKTSMTAVNRKGVIEQVSKRTPDTSVCVREAIAFGMKHRVPWTNVVWDRGGGGKQHADAMRAQGYPVRSVGFGEAVAPDPKRGLTKLDDRIDQKEERYAYVNRRSQMYGDLSELLDPSYGGEFAIDERYAELFLQMAPIPRVYDPEGRLKLPPKHKKTREDNTVTLVDIIGHSPDELDSLVLAVHGMLYAKKRQYAGAVR